MLSTIKTEVDDEVVSVLVGDGVTFQVSLKVLKLSKTIQDVIEDAGLDDTIPLPNITSKTFERYVGYAKSHLDNPSSQSISEGAAEAAAAASLLSSIELRDWEKKHLTHLDQTALFELILASNYLDFEDLLNACCKTLAPEIARRTPTELREYFGIEKDFTPEEEEAVRRENDWLEPNEVEEEEEEEGNK